MKFLWITLGWTSVGLGIIGAFLPLLPTTPFLLLAAYSFSRGSEKLHHWLVTHPKLGPPIVNWQTHRAIAKPVKIYATLSMLAIFGLSLALRIPWWALIAQAIVLTAVTVMLWTRREGPAHDGDAPAQSPQKEISTK